MSYNITVEGGTSVRLPTAGKYCDGDILVTATGGADAIVSRTITKYSSDKLTSIGAAGFMNCASLKTIDCPNVTSVGNRAFSQSGITRLEFPKLTSIGGDACTYCYSLTYVDLGGVVSIPSWAFASCRELRTLILRKTGTITTLLATNTLSDTAIAKGTGYIYVPDNLVESYKTATNWVTYANQIRAIEDYPEICGG
jgi:hypothetical protein